MEKEIVEQSDKPEALENLYREDPQLFSEAFQKSINRFKDQKLAEFWKIRLHKSKTSITFITWGKRREIWMVVVFSVIAGILVKLPAFINLNEEAYYQRNAIFFFAPFIAGYLFYKKNISVQKTLPAFGIMLLTLIYSNTLHYWNEGQILILSYLHIPIVIWFIVGWFFGNGDWKNLNSRLEYLSFNGSLAVIMAIILASGAILTGLAVALFSFINKDIGEIIAGYAAPAGLVASPILGTYIINTNPGIVDRLSPLVAKIFSHLAILVLIAFLIASLFSSQNPFYDREFLLVINLVFIAVIALSLFLVSETKDAEKAPYNIRLIFILSALSIIIGLISLSSIIFRISEWGFTANRMAVLGSNILLLIHTGFILYDSFLIIRGKAKIDRINSQMAKYLTVYGGWVTVVAFIFPIIF